MTFLRHYWSSVHGSTREKDLYRAIKENVKSKAQAVKFSQDIREAAKLYGAALSDKADFWKGYRSTDKNNVQLLLRLKLEQHRPLLLAVFQHFSKPEIQKTLASLISWSIRGLIGGVMGKGSAETTFCEAAKQVRAGKVKTRDGLRAHFTSFVPSDSQFQNDFSTYRTNNNAFARLLLWGLERGLQGEQQPELVPNENVDEINLEHILPKRAKISDWAKFTVDEIAFYSLRLGNMTLLKERDNNALGNKPFSKKKTFIGKSKFKLNAGIGSKTDWIKKEIETRQSVLANAAVKTWKL